MDIGSTKVQIFIIIIKNIRDGGSTALQTAWTLFTLFTLLYTGYTGYTAFTTYTAYIAFTDYTVAYMPTYIAVW